MIVGYQYNVAIGRLVEAIQNTEKGKSQWELRLKEECAEFGPSFEIGFAGTSTDELAETRARRLLLNENPAKDTRDINEVTRELFVQGMETVLRVEKSPFPTIYRH